MESEWIEEEWKVKKYMVYVPAILFTAFYLMTGLIGASLALSMVLIWITCFWIAALLLHKGLFWGGVFGLLLFYVILGFNL